MAERTYERLSLGERGLNTSRPSLRPVRLVRLDDRAVTFTRREKEHVVPWTRIARAEVVHGHRMVRRLGIDYPTRLLRLTTDDGEKFVLDVSTEYPEFERSEELLRELIQGLRVTLDEYARVPVWKSRWFAAIVLLLVLGAALWFLNMWAGLALLALALLASTFSLPGEVPADQAVSTSGGQAVGPAPAEAG